MNIFDAPKGKLDLTIAPKQVTNDKANLEATRSKQEAAFRSLPGDDQLAQKNRESKRRIQALSAPIPLKKKGIESTPLTGGEYRFDDTRGTGFGQNPVVQTGGWDPAVTAVKLASAFLAQDVNPVKHEENSKVALAGALRRIGSSVLKGTKAVPKEAPLTLANRGAGAARGAFVGGSYGQSAGEAAQDNLIVGNTGNGSSNTSRNFTLGGALTGAALGAARPSYIGRGHVMTAAANTGSRLSTGKSLLGHVNEIPITTGKSDKSVGRHLFDDWLKDEKDVSVMDLYEGTAPDDFEVNPLIVNKLQKLKDSEGLKDLINRPAAVPTPGAAPTPVAAPTPGGSTDVANLARRVGRAALPVASAAFQGGRRLGRAGLEGVGGLLSLIRANAQDSTANTPGSARPL